MRGPLSFAFAATLALPMSYWAAGHESRDRSRDAYTLPMSGLSDAEREAFFRGRALFRQVWVIAPAQEHAVDGLGPTFNRLSCVACHPRNGRGFAPEGPDEQMRTMLVRLSLPGHADHPVYGDQLNDHAIPGVPAEGRAAIHWEAVAGRYGDGEAYSLRRPRIEWRDLAFGSLGPEVLTSARIGQPVYGLGLLEAVSPDTLRELAQRPRAIEGRLNRLSTASAVRGGYGRFGWKANQGDLVQQVAAAAHGDLGLTSSLFPEQNCPSAQPACRAAPDGGQPELTEAQLADMTAYLRLLAVPARRDRLRPVVQRGEALFRTFGCDGCHTPTLVTSSDAAHPVLASRRIDPYTDLLLHDMGEALADGRPDHDASGREWRTPALWGIGLARHVGGRVGFLHDGRARSLAEAILWHGGQAETAREAFRTAPGDARVALLEFLESL